MPRDRGDLLETYEQRLDDQAFEAARATVQDALNTIQPPTAAERPDPRTPPAAPAGGQSAAGAVVSDVAGGLIGRPTGGLGRVLPFAIQREAVGGLRDFVVEAGRTLELLGDQLRPFLPDALRGKVQVRLPEVGGSGTITGGLIRSTAQFLAGFVPASKALGGLGVGNAFVRGGGAGAAADFAGFDPQQPRVSNLLNELAPALRTPVTEYLAADPNDTEAGGRLKQTLEGLGLGTLAQGVVAVVGAIRASGRALGRARPRTPPAPLGAPEAPGGAPGRPAAAAPQGAPAQAQPGAVPEGAPTTPPASPAPAAAAAELDEALRGTPETAGPPPGPVSAERAAVDALAEAPAPFKAAATGKTATAVTERGTAVETTFALVDARDLVASHDTAFRPRPEFPVELQPRDRSRAVSELQARKLEENLVPRFLGESPKAGEGAPIVGADGIVESGNLRTIVLQRLYAQGAPNGTRYREWLTRNAARFGLTADQVATVEQPVVVRIRQTPVDRAAFAREANEAAVAAMSATETARADAQQLGGLLDQLRPSETGDLATAANRDFVRAFFGKVAGPQELGRFVDAGGQLSQEGLARVRNALFATVFDDPAVVARLAESTDDNVRAITNGLVTATPRLATLKAAIAAGDAPPLDLAPDLAAALTKFSALRRAGVSVDDFLRQQGLFGAELTPFQTEVLRWLQTTGRSAKAVATTLDRYVDLVEQQGSPKQGGLFGEGVPASREALFRQAAAGEGGQAGLVSTGTPKAASVSGEAGGAVRSSLQSPPPSTQPASGPAQRSSLAPPSGVATERSNAPSAMTGPSSTVGVSGEPAGVRGSMDRTSSRIVLQPSDDVNDLLRLAADGRPELERTLGEVAREVPGLTPIAARVKGAIRLAEKLRTRPADTVSDYVAGRFGVSSRADVDAALAALSRRHEVVKVEDFLDSPRSGYRAVHVDLRLSNGLSAEVQLVPQDIAAIQERLHPLFEKWRGHSATLTAEQAADRQRDLAAMREAYDEAFARFEARADVGTAAGPGAGRGSRQAGELQVELLVPLARAVAGGTIGGLTGDTPEARLRNALIGAGLGAAASPRLLRRLLDLTGGEGRPAGTRPPSTLRPVGAAQTRRAAAALRDARPEDAQVARVLGPEPKDLQIAGKVLDVNFDRLETPDDVKALIARVSQVFQREIDAARARPQPHAQTEQLANDLGLTVEQFLAVPTDRALSPAEALASRKLLLASAERLRGLADAVTAGDEAAKIPFVKQLGLHVAIQARAGAFRTRAGQALDSYRIDASGELQHLTALGEVLDDLKTGVTAERAAQMVASLDTPEQLQTLLRLAERPGAGDVFTEAWINALVSGPQSQAANITGSLWTTFRAVGERFLAAGIGAGRAGHVAVGEANALTYGLLTGWQDALRLAAKAFREGAPQRAGTKLDRPTQRAIAGETFGLSGPVGRAIDLLGETWRLPTRLLGTADEFFFAVNYRMELHAQSYREAVARGAQGADVTRVLREVVNDPPARVREAAERFALAQTFQTELTGRLKAFQQAASGPAGKLVVPFLKTPTNIFTDSLERLPGLNLFLEGTRADLRAGGARADLAIAKVTLGTLTAATAATLVGAGLLTGGGPKNPALRALKRATGWQPYSLKVGDTYVSYSRLEPLSTILGLAADTAEILGQVDDTTADELGFAVTLALAKNLTNKTFLVGFAEAVDAIHDPETAGKDFVKGLARGAVPGLVGQVERTLVDPTLRDTHDLSLLRELVNSVRSRVPGFSDDLPPQRNLFGEPIALEGGVGPDLVSPLAVSTARQDPVADELARLRVPLRLPERQLGGVPLDPQEADRFQVLAAGLEGPGPTLHQRLAAEFQTAAYQRASDGPDGGKALRVRSIVQAFRERAAAQLTRESPVLDELVSDTVRQRAERLRPAGVP